MILDTVYTELETQLGDKLRTNFNQPGFKKLGTVDLFADQFTAVMEGEELALVYPAILIEILDIPWETKGRLSQSGVATIRFHIGQLWIDYTKRKSDSLAYLDFAHVALQGFSGSIFNKLTRGRTTLGGANSQMQVHILEYRTQVEDRSADKYGSWVHTTGPIDVEPDPDPNI